MNTTTEKLILDVCRKINDILQSISLPALKPSKLDMEAYVLRSTEYSYKVLCKNEFTASMIQQLVQLEDKSELLLTAPYISPVNGQMLRKHHIQYADAAGNLFLHHKEQLILITNCAKPAFIEQQKTSGRAWTLSGLKLLFLLLTEADALNWTYRKLAEYSAISLGSIRYIMADLKEKNAILELDGKLVWNDFQQILFKWCDLYVEKMVPVLEKIHYSGTLPEEQGSYPLSVSGESAEICKGILKSKCFLAYKAGNLNACILKNHWIEDAEGAIEIRMPFWPSIRNFQNQVPPLLVYADLLAENDSRCKEAAGKIYQNYLQRNCPGNRNLS